MTQPWQNRHGDNGLETSLTSVSVCCKDKASGETCVCVSGFDSSSWSHMGVDASGISCWSKKGLSAMTGVSVGLYPTASGMGMVCGLKTNHSCEWGELRAEHWRLEQDHRSQPKLDVHVNSPANFKLEWLWEGVLGPGCIQGLQCPCCLITCAKALFQGFCSPMCTVRSLQAFGNLHLSGVCVLVTSSSFSSTGRQCSTWRPTGVSISASQPWPESSLQGSPGMSFPVYTAMGRNARTQGCMVCS